ncbi:putative eukaryotic translation initiation factor 5B-like [Capsicum annuum]|nr:putative eukaryotic translation initiation factor 5B-like [Capsicum annuum]
MLKIMDLRKKGCFILLLVLLVHVVGGNVVFNVEHKFGGRGKAVLRELKAHDVRRHGRMLAPEDFQLGGNGNPTGSGLYFARISIGTPSKDYHVQVDTGSDLFWIELTQYNIYASTSGKSITCEQDVCAATFEGESSECKVGKPCKFEVKYVDGTTVEGNLVQDRVNLDQVSGDYKASPLQGNIAFGIDDGFPAVTFKFKGNLSLTAYPHDYLHENEGQWCFGWQDGAEVKSPPASLLALEEWRKASLLWPFSLILNCVATLIIP